MKLYAHQEKIISEDPKKTGLWLGTGSGKTRTALFLARGSTLVICPKTQKEDRNWERELDTLIEKRPDKWRKATEITELKVVSKEKFRQDHTELAKFDTVIVDEAHTCLGVTPNVRYVKKQPIPKTSQLFEALNTFLQKHPPERFYMATATIMKSPMTVWGAAKLLGRNWNFYEFRDAFYIKLPMPGREVWRAKNDMETKERLAKAAQSLGYVGRLEDFFDVPDQTFKTIHVELTAEQKARIKDMKIDYPEPIVRVGKIHQIENGVLAGDEFNEPEYFDNAKIDKILDLAIEFPRMVIFAKYISQINEISNALKKLNYKVLTFTGSTKNRGEVIKEANESEQCIFIAQSQISSGWQLGKTKEHPEYYDYNCMIFASMDYSVINRIQGEGRILRSDNLKKNLYIDLVVKGGVDEAVKKCIDNKQDFDEQLYVKKYENS